MALTRRAVRQARVADRRGFVDAAADLADDALADIEQLLVVAEADAGLLDLAFDFDVDRAGAVHHDVGDVVARKQRLERAEAEHVVADVVEQFFLLGDRHHDVLDRDDLVDDVADFLARAIGIEARQLRQIDRLDQRAEDDALDLVIGFRAARIDRRHVDGRRRAGRRRRRDQRRAQPVRGNRRAAGFHRRRRRRLRHRAGCAGAAASAAGTASARFRCSTTPTEHGNGLRTIVSSIASSAWRAAESAGRRAIASPRRGRSAPAPIGGTFPRSCGSTTPRRSSGRCWRRFRTSAARTG